VFQLQPRPVQSSYVQGSVAERTGYSTIPPEKMTGAQQVSKCLVYNTTRMYNLANCQGRQKHTIQLQHHLHQLMSLDSASVTSSTKPSRTCTNYFIIVLPFTSVCPKMTFSDFPVKIRYRPELLRSSACYTTSQLILIHLIIVNNFGKKITELLVMLFSPPSCHFLLLKYQYFPQYPHRGGLDSTPGQVI